MTLGTAKISECETPRGYRYFEVRWMNVGNFLRNEPRNFVNRDEAIAFCRERGLRVVS